MLGRCLGGLLIGLSLAPAVLEAEPGPSFDEIGKFYSWSLGAEDYGSSQQNWAVVQGPDDLIYVGNGNGVTVFDGASWRLIQFPNRSSARSLAVSAEGQIFIGGNDEFGYLAPNAQGQMGYVSLMDHIASEDRDVLGAFTSIGETSDGVYFLSYERLFRWDGREMKAWHGATRFLTCLSLGDVLYVHQEGVGLLQMTDDTLTMAPGGDAFQDKVSYSLIAWDEESYLAITLGHGVFQCPTAGHRDSANRSPACTPFGPDLTEWLSSLQPYRGTVLPEGTLAIATLRGGVVLVDRGGRLLRVLDGDSGLRSDSVYNVFVDRQGALWLALEDGLNRVEVGSSLSYWDKTLGLAGGPRDMVRHEGRLYVASSQGVFSLESGAMGAAPRFLPFPGISEQCFGLLSTPQGLLAGCMTGLYNIDLQQKIWSDQGTVYTLYRSPQDPTVLYLGLNNGLARMRLRAPRWTDGERLDAVRAPVRAIVEDARGRLWLGTRTEGIVLLQMASSPSEDQVPSATVIARFGVAEGLPAGLNLPKTLAGKVVALSISESGGLWRLDSEAEPTAFVPDTTFDAFLPQGSGSLMGVAEDEEGRVWISAGAASGVAQPAEDGYTWRPTRLRRTLTTEVYTTYVEPGGSVWLAGSYGLIRHDTSGSKVPSTRYPVWIRRVTDSSGMVLYDGYPGDASTEWTYEQNDLRFAFSAPRYDALERTAYRVRLDGFDRAGSGDDGWSEWVHELDKDYTNLWEGSYVFRVQARDVYGVVSREDSLAFRILPPWYRSWWAYFLYALALATGILAFVRSQQKRVERERAAAERERAISRRLREVDKLKDEFLANTSHELRTPLYGITGLAESLLEGAAGDLSQAVRRNLTMIAASGRRLGHLVNDILDFSKLRHKNLELHRQPVDLHALVDVVLTLSRPLAEGKKLRLENRVPIDLPSADADEDRLQQILYNLLGNAIKFTDEGMVEVRAKVEGDRLVVRVVDTGIGIPSEQQERIFQAFEQADASVEREYGGTGLGLAVTRRLVELHGGEIWLESEPDVGSTFSFSLPVVEPDAEPRATTKPGPSVAPRATVESAQDVVRDEASEEPLPAPELEVVAPGELPPVRGGAVRILAVDDEPVNRQVLTNYLALEHFDLVTASGGEEALRLIEEQPFDLVLLDVMMPRVSGYEVCRALREKYPMEKLPVLFLTAKNRTADVVTGLSLGANDFLTKPISKGELLARVRPHLDLLTVHRNLEDLVDEKVSEIKILEGLLPICATCKKIRDEGGKWSELETFIGVHSEAEFSHGICPDCAEEFYSDYLKDD